MQLGCVVKKLSESPLWKLQTRTFQDLGLDCWLEKGTPYQLTNSPLIARQYAAIALQLIKEREEKFSIIEMGAGTGRFAYLFIIELQKKLREAGLSEEAFCYFLTDISPKNLEFWQKHPLLIPYIEKGLVQTSLELPKVKAPLVVGNYLLDSLPQDIYRVKEGELYEGRVEIKGATLEEVEIDYYFTKLKTAPTPILAEYQKELESATFFVPTGAFNLFSQLDKQYGKNYTFLTADKGPTKTADFLEQIPRVEKFGCYYFPVNFDALHRHIAHCLGPKKPHPSFSIHLFSTKTPFSQELNKSYCEAVDAYGPQELFEEQKQSKDILELIEKSNYDPGIFFSNYTFLEKNCTEKILHEIYPRIFPICREEALCYHQLAALGNIPEEWKTLSQQFSHLPSIQKEKITLEKPEETLVIADKNQNYPHYHSIKNLPEKSLKKYPAIVLITKDKTKASSPAIISSGEKMLQDVEKQLPNLQTIKYSDNDLEQFLKTQQNVDEQNTIHFFQQLAKRGNITQEQLAKYFPQSEQEDSLLPITLDLFKNYLEAGGTLQIYLENGRSKYEDPEFTEQIILNPFVDYSEERKTSHLLITITLFSSKK
ncbi:MAG: hypothetical protein ChlgKO_05840 [Chlamydiales bacterium]